MKLILLGAPGAGKGTQAEFLSKELGIPTISTGNILREAIKNGTPTGLKAKSFMDEGQLVPDEVIIGIVEERVSRDDCRKGYILDGVPRTLHQARELDRFGVAIDQVVSIELDDAVIEARMTGRRVCSGCGESYHIKANPPKIDGICDDCGSPLIVRSDDNAETVRARLAVYHQMTEQLKGYYADLGKLKLVQGHQAIDAVHRDILAALGVSV